LNYEIITKEQYKKLKKYDRVLRCQDGIDRMTMFIEGKGTCLVPYKVDDDLAEMIVNNMSFNKQKGAQ
tara:strand:+ start:198 stop:401 length:204 start_codon:yes stop_codon:yes gene_type:complete